MQYANSDTISQSGVPPAAATVSRLRLLLPALAVGVLTGLVAAAFRAALHAAEAGRTWLFESQRGAAGVAATSLVVLGLIGLALWLVRCFAPETAGSGIPHLKLVLSGRGVLDWRRIMSVKFASGLAAIAGGLCLGREGPTIQMGAALGSLWAKLTRAGGDDLRSLNVAGASAGLAAAYNAPLSGIIFALEELRVGLPTAAMFAALVAAIAADVVIRLILGSAPTLAGPAPAVPPLEALPLFMALGAVVGVVGCKFSVALVFLTRQLDFQSNLAHGLKVAAATAAVVVAGYWNAGFVGGGEPLVTLVLTGSPALGFLVLALAVRFGLSVGSYAVGTAGGIFAPILVIGGLAGGIIGRGLADWFPALSPDAATFAVAGMAAMFAAVVRCPLTGLVLMIEMTGHYTLILPLLVACFMAQLVADALGVAPVYAALLRQQQQPPRP